MLTFSAIRLDMLDDDGARLAVASGFVRREFGRLWLYTCWSSVAGCDRHDVRVPPEPARPRYLRAWFQAGEGDAAFTSAGATPVHVPLYEATDGVARPRWLQDPQHLPHAALDALGLFVPSRHGLVKLELPSELPVSDLHLASTDAPLQDAADLGVGDTCTIVGCPSTRRAAQPDAAAMVALAKSLVDRRFGHGRRQWLLDGAGDPAMTGGPAFVERAGGWLLFGVHAGPLGPVGVVDDITMVLSGQAPLVRPEALVRTA